jgi:hypothetical protein
MIQFIKKLFGPKFVYRSSVTGEFVTREYARLFPDTTVKERVR